MVSCASLLLTALCLAADPAPTQLFDFEGAFDVTAIRPSGVEPSLVQENGSQALALTVRADRDWPGIALRPAGDDSWDLSAHERLEIDVRNAGDAKATLNCRVDNPGADGTSNCNNGYLALEAGQSGTLVVTFNRRDTGMPGIELFGMRGYPFNTGERGTIDTAAVTALTIFVGRPQADTHWVIDNIRAVGAAAPRPALADGATFMPFVDTFGQYIHRDWPGKVHSLDDLRSRVATEAADLTANPGPTGWNQWGGWEAGPQLEATGWFRVTKQDGQWWLVDPAGRLFWSHGVDCVGAVQSTPIAEREAWWQDFPGDQPGLDGYFENQSALHGHYAGQQFRGYAISAANLHRKYGADWRERWFDLAHTRLRSWGHNTIANWSRREVQAGQRTPYVATAGTGGKILAGSTGYWGQFRDVFDPSFEADTRRNLENHRGGAAGDPWCLGFFVDNEIAWGSDVSLAAAALQSPADQAAKLVFVDDLRAKYTTIDALNAVWGSDYASWDALIASTDAPDLEAAREDLTTFYTKFAERYFSVVRDAVKAVAPHQLYLGVRFAWVNDLAAAAAAKYCDVVSYNLYTRDVAQFKTNAGDVPLIIGEFHFGALDRGMFHTGLVSTGSQDDRANHYRSYVLGAVRHPQFVGTHWFQFQDQALTGRALDEENYQIGFLDGCDTPYPEIVAAAREIGANLYQTRLDAAPGETP